MVSTLTAKQEHFAQLVAFGSNNSDAYRQAYNVAIDTLPETIWNKASRIASESKVRTRIDALKAGTEAALAEKRLWDLERVMESAEKNLDGAQNDHQWASANGALEFIGKVTGLVTNKPSVPGVQITRITVVLDPSAVEPRNLEIETRYKILDAGDEDADEA